jgi:hypothetical protein
MAGILGRYYGTPNVTFNLSSSVTGTTRTYTSLQAMVDEVTMARIAGGMHFRSSTVAGEALGRSVADWVASANAFKPK